MIDPTVGFTNSEDCVATVIKQFVIVPKSMGRGQEKRLPSRAIAEKSHSFASDKGTSKL